MLFRSHFEARECDLRAGRADIKTHADKWHAFKRLRVDGQKIVVVIVIEIALAVSVPGESAECMIGERVAWRPGVRHDG